MPTDAEESDAEESHAELFKQLQKSRKHLVDDISVFSGFIARITWYEKTITQSCAIVVKHWDLLDKKDAYNLSKTYLKLLNGIVEFRGDLVMLGAYDFECKHFDDFRLEVERFQNAVASNPAILKAHQ